MGFVGRVFKCLGMYNMCVMEFRFEVALVFVTLVMVPLARGAIIFIGGVCLMLGFSGDCGS